MKILTKMQFVCKLKTLQGKTITSVVRGVLYPITKVSDDFIEGRNGNGTPFKLDVNKLWDAYNHGITTRKGLLDGKYVSRNCDVSPALAILKLM